MSTPILRDFPDHFETARLTIRCPQRGDGAETHEAVMESLGGTAPVDAMGQRSTNARKPGRGRAARPHGVHGAQRPDDVAFPQRNGHDWSAAAGCTASTGAYRALRSAIGCAHFMPVRATSVKRCAVSLPLPLTRWAARRVEIRCDERNTRSANVARRTGFALEGILHHNRRHHLTSDLVNTMIFAQTRSD